MTLYRKLSPVKRKVFSTNWVWVIAVIAGFLLGFGMSRTAEVGEAKAESGDTDLSTFRAEFEEIKAKQKRLAAKWQSELLAQVVPTLADDSHKAKREFLSFLEELGSPGTAALVAMLQDPEKRVRREAVKALGEIGEDERKAGRSPDLVATGLATALQDSEQEVVREALRKLGDVRPTSAESLAVVVPALIAAKRDGSSGTRDDIVDILGKIGERGAKEGKSTDLIRDALIVSLADTSTKVRTNAIEELSDIRAASVETFAALIAVLSDESKSVRADAEDVLIKFGKTEPTSLAPMVADALMKSGTAVTRNHLVDVLGEIGEVLVDSGKSETIVTEPLLIALKDSAKEVRRNAADELGEMQATSPEVVAALTAALQDNSKAVRESAQKVLKRIEKRK